MGIHFVREKVQRGEVRVYMSNLVCKPSDSTVGCDRFDKYVSILFLYVISLLALV